MPLPRLRSPMPMMLVPLMVLTFMFVDVWSGRNWIYLIAAGVVPPLVFLRFWNNGPAETLAAIVRSPACSR
jgi:hypothetical protein